MDDSDAFLRSHASLDFSRYCLSYLFTTHKFNGDTLGVAYVNGTCEKYQRVKDLVSFGLRTSQLSFKIPTFPLSVENGDLYEDQHELWLHHHRGPKRARRNPGSP